MLTTGLFTVHRTGQPDTAGVPGHATYRGGAEASRADQRRQQVGAWSLALGMAAWPVTEVDTVSDQDGTLYQVHAAARRPGMTAATAHVVVDCDTVTRDPDLDGTVDAEGNSLTEVADAPAPGALTLVDNADGTFTVSGTAVTTAGDGTYTVGGVDADSNGLFVLA